MGLWSFWLIIAVGFLIAELLTLSTTCLYIGIGALLAMGVALLGGGWVATIITFVAATALIYLLSFLWRDALLGFLHKGTPAEPTGMDALIGRTGTVYISDRPRIRIDGDTWAVATRDGAVSLSEHDKVRVVDYDSIILIVEIFK